MKLKTIFLGLEAGGRSVVIMNGDDAERLGVLALGRVTVRLDGIVKTAIVNTSTEMIEPGRIGVCKRVWEGLGLADGSEVEVEVAPFPDSIYFIRNKLDGRKLAFDEVLEIVEDTVAERLKRRRDHRLRHRPPQLRPSTFRRVETLPRHLIQGVAVKEEAPD